MAEVPRFEMTVLEPPCVHLLDRPLARGLQVGRAGQPRTIDVGQHLDRLHDFRMVGAFLTDLPEGVGVDALVGLERDERGQQHRHERNVESSHESLTSE